MSYSTISIHEHHTFLLTVYSQVHDENHNYLFRTSAIKMITVYLTGPQWKRQQSILQAQSWKWQLSISQAHHENGNSLFHRPTIKTIKFSLFHRCTMKTTKTIYRVYVPGYFISYCYTFPPMYATLFLHMPVFNTRCIVCDQWCGMFIQ